MSIPLSGEERVSSIDFIRGISIMGILMVNAPSLNGPPIKDTVDFAFQSSFLDIWYSQFIFFVAVEKFYPIFALLFGISMSMFLTNKKGFNQTKIFIRRQIALLFIGCLHITFVWWGDILTVYSILGLLILPISFCSSKDVLKIFSLMLVLGIITSLIIAFLPANENVLYQPSSSLVYSTGTFFMVSKQRILDFYGVYFPGIFYELDLSHFLSSMLYFWQLLLLLILGFYTNSSGLLKKITTDKLQALTVVKLTLMLTVILYCVTKFDALEEIVSTWQGITQALFYASIFLYWFQTKRVQSFFSLWANVGRMSLTNYLFHTTSLSLIFYGYGLGFYGRIGPFMQVPIIISLMLSSIFLSNLWLRYFNFGPIEWLWRALTYGQFSPMLKNKKLENRAFEG